MLWTRQATRTSVERWRGQTPGGVGRERHIGDHLIGSGTGIRGTSDAGGGQGNGSKWDKDDWGWAQ